MKINKTDIKYLVRSVLNELNEFKAYHGTANNFDEFSLDYWHSGEGSNVYGRGVYLSGCYDTAAYYARNVGHTYGNHDNIKYNGDTNEYRDKKFMELAQKAKIGDFKRIYGYNFDFICNFIMYVKT